MPDIRYAQNENVDRGDLRMQVIERGTSTPIDDAKISISYSGDPDSTVEEVNTDASGMSETLTLDTPPLELSMQPSEVQPYAEYTIQVTAKGYRPINISGIEVFSGQLSLQEIRMDAEKATESMTCTYPFCGISAQDRGSRDQTRHGNRRDRFKPCGDPGICDCT